MELTRKESSVVRRVRRQRVVTMKALREELRISHMTVVRALTKYGYFTSINGNAAYYTLHDIPRFDAEGLWTYRNSCFSKHRTLARTLVALVEGAAAGRTVAELEQRVKTKVGNVLSRLARQEKLVRRFSGRQAVYLALDDQRQQQQLAQRDLLRQEARAMFAPREASKPSFPPRGDVIVVLDVLIEIIKNPTANAAALAKAVRARGTKLNAVQVQRVMDFYGLEKKRHSGRR